MARQAIDAAAQEGLFAAGVAVALPGLVEVKTGTLLRAPNLGWSGIVIAEELRRRLGPRPVRVENEANLAALAEHWQGAAQGLRSFICVFGEVGVGAGIFVDGGLFRGAHGFGGEFGHLTLDPTGETCACGSRGCLETFVGQEAIARRAGVDSAAGGRTQSITDELVRRASSGDGRTLDSLREAGRLLGIGLASAVNLLDVDAIVLGGCFGPLAPWLEDRIRAVLDERVLSARWSACELRASELGETAAVRGAAALTLSAVIAEPWTMARRRGEIQGAVS
jgi:predicted NBD/HSP70 family sugar kinase